MSSDRGRDGGRPASSALALAGGAWLRVPHFDTVFHADLRRALDIRLLPLLLSIIMVDFFDTSGPSPRIASRPVTCTIARGASRGFARYSPSTRSAPRLAGLRRELGDVVYRVSRWRAEGARTGLHNVSWRPSSPPDASPRRWSRSFRRPRRRPALIVVGFLMCQQIARMDFTALDTAIPRS